MNLTMQVRMNVQFEVHLNFDVFVVFDFLVVLARGNEHSKSIANIRRYNFHISQVGALVYQPCITAIWVWQVTELCDASSCIETTLMGKPFDQRRKIYLPRAALPSLVVRTLD